MILVILKKITSLFLTFIYRYIFNNHTGTSVMGYTASVIEPYSTNYISFKTSPKYSKYYVQSKIATTTTDNEFAIVLQGLIETKDNITLETVRFYKKMCPKAIIIISTWDYTETNILKDFQNEGCEIVLSKDIPICGTGNVNYQITTSLAGLKRAKELGAVYSVKCRSDMRFYRDNFLEFLKSLLSVFPVDVSNPLKLKGRIVSQSGNWGQMFLPNWLQDFWYFGYTDDLINFFDIKKSNQQIHSTVKYLKSLGKIITGDDLFNENTPEMYLCGTFVHKYINEPDSVKLHWDLLKKYFIIVNQEDVLSKWLKYGIRNDSVFYVENNGTNNYTDSAKNISFADWLNIYTGSYIYENWMENEKSNYIVFKGK